MVKERTTILFLFFREKFPINNAGKNDEFDQNDRDEKNFVHHDTIIH